jgi:septum formation protein
MIAEAPRTGTRNTAVVERNRHLLDAREPAGPSRPHDSGLHPAGVVVLPKVHLASSSPRRRQILTDAGIPHTAGAPALDDAQLSPGNVSPEEWVAALAYLKARSVAHGRDGVVIGADTVVVRDGAIIGQPKDARDAERILRLLVGGNHRVLTGVALVDAPTGRRELFVESADVSVGHVPDGEIAAYIAGDGWKGKAGAYNLSERLQAGWPVHYRGDASTIMGLPVEKLVPRLLAFAGT